ncbi:MFS transporter [Ferviditalea candida]|uniref:MFS transporter n=1 Tax=Ferviditalea candida TaxID=3108399 RepID=A0ABU5ZD68_9BACL|nr:MFS transporter [Paenibacillaceae bacterium T2]
MQAALANRQEMRKTMYHILFAISLVHLLNDSMQAVIPAILPILKSSMSLSYLQVGLIVFALNITASVLQPAFGLYTDLKPSPYLLPIGMSSTFLGMLGLAFAPSFYFVLMSVIMVGIGSAVFHPEASRVAHMAAGARKGLAQSIFQVGGNSGQSLAPIMTALIFVRLGQFGAIWFTIAAFTAILIQLYIAEWYRQILHHTHSLRAKTKAAQSGANRQRKVAVAMSLLLVFVFARSWYHSAITNYYPFFLLDKYHIPLQQTQIYIFLFLAAGAIGTFLGGPLSDRLGKRNILLFSMLGSAPLAMLLPYANLFWAYVISLVNGFIILSSFSVLVVYAQELMPGRVGMVSGLTIGLAFGMGAIGSAVLGGLADKIGIAEIMKLSSYLPLSGLVALLLPTDQTLRKWGVETES